MPHVTVKGRIDSNESVVFGLSENDLNQVRESLGIWGHRVGQDGRQLTQHALDVVGLLTDQLGFFLITTCPGPHSTVIYTLHRPFRHPGAAINRGVF